MQVVEPIMLWWVVLRNRFMRISLEKLLTGYSCCRIPSSLRSINSLVKINWNFWLGQKVIFLNCGVNYARSSGSQEDTVYEEHLLAKIIKLSCTVRTPYGHWPEIFPGQPVSLKHESTAGSDACYWGKSNWKCCKSQPIFLLQSLFLINILFVPYNAM